MPKILPLQVKALYIPKDWPMQIEVANPDKCKVLLIMHLD